MRPGNKLETRGFGHAGHDVSPRIEIAFPVNRSECLYNREDLVKIHVNRDSSMRLSFMEKKSISE